MDYLSDEERIALSSFRQERDYWKSALFDAVRLSPEVSEEALRAALLAGSDPFPDNAFGIRDREALLDGEISKFGGFSGFKEVLLDYPLPVILRVCPELGMPLPSKAECVFKELVGDRGWGFPWPAADLQIQDFRLPYEEGNMLYRREVSGTIDGALRRVGQAVDTVTSDFGPWEEVA